MKEFCARSLEVDELASILKHIEVCGDCDNLFHSVLRQRVGDSPRSIDLSNSWLKHEHIVYEQLVAFADDQLDETERQMLDIHLGGCSSCREDLRSFLDYRKLADTVKNVRYAPVLSTNSTLTPTWFGINQRYGIAAAAAIVLVGALLSVLVLRGHSGSTPHTTVSQTTTNPNGEANKFPADNQSKSNGASSVTSASGAGHTNGENLALTTANPSRKRNGTKQAAIAANVIRLRDGKNNLVLNENGVIAGLDNVSTETNRLVQRALATQSAERPSILDDLGGQDSGLRGSNVNAPSFKLTSPVGVVILDDKAVFVWQSVGGATSYQVQVADLNGHEVLKSPKLSSNETKWVSTQPLKRGGIYAWSVTAIVSGNEITSPASSARETKFEILGERDLESIQRIRTVSNSHLLLGLLYAKLGLIADAEKEFGELLRQNPNSLLVAKLAHSVQSGR
jgi:hypothetical protein